MATGKELLVSMLHIAITKALTQNEPVVVTARSRSEVEFLLCVIQDLLAQRRLHHTPITDTCYQIEDGATIEVIAKELTVEQIKQSLIRSKH